MQDMGEIDEYQRNKMKQSIGLAHHSWDVPTKKNKCVEIHKHESFFIGLNTVYLKAHPMSSFVVVKILPLRELISQPQQNKVINVVCLSHLIYYMVSHSFMNKDLVFSTVSSTRNKLLWNCVHVNDNLTAGRCWQVIKGTPVQSQVHIPHV